MVLRRSIKERLIAVELDEGDVLELSLPEGRKWRMGLGKTRAEVASTNLKQLKVEQDGGLAVIRFFCEIEVNGAKKTLERELCTQKSFYEPWEIDGVVIWFDAVDAIFEFLEETHGACRPRRQARFAFSLPGRPICPEPLQAWCQLPEGGLRIEDCYNGDDCWLGGYRGASAHGGLDINHPAGTPLFAPLKIDDHELFNSLEKGDNNNRWRGIHRWPDGGEWVFQSHHVIKILYPEHEPIPAGARYAEGAGVFVGDHDHSHFVFKVREKDDPEPVLLDPWILFRQIGDWTATPANTPVSSGR